MTTLLSNLPTFAHPSFWPTLTTLPHSERFLSSGFAGSLCGLRRGGWEDRGCALLWCCSGGCRCSDSRSKWGRLWDPQKLEPLDLKGDTDQTQKHQTGQRQHWGRHAAWLSKADQRTSSTVAIPSEHAMSLLPHVSSLYPLGPPLYPTHHADFGIQQGSQMSDHNGIVEHTQRENEQPLTPTSNPLHQLPPLTRIQSGLFAKVLKLFKCFSSAYKGIQWK